MQFSKLILFSPISPIPLELPASDELVAIENAEVLHQNGFEIEVNGGDMDGNRRLKLVAQPVSKTTVFDLKGFARPRFIPVTSMANATD